MKINNWSLVEKEDDRRYSFLGDGVDSVIIGNINTKDGVSYIATGSIKDICGDKAICENGNEYDLGYTNRDYYNYVVARYNKLSIITDWFVYKEDEKNRLIGLLKDEDELRVIDDEIISYNPLSGRIILNDNDECFASIKSINCMIKNIIEDRDIDEKNIKNIVISKYNISLPKEETEYEYKKELKNVRK